MAEALNIRIPPDDGAIDKALQQLNDRLAIWQQVSQSFYSTVVEYANRQSQWYAYFEDWQQQLVAMQQQLASPESVREQPSEQDAEQQACSPIELQPPPIAPIALVDHTVGQDATTTALGQVAASEESDTANPVVMTAADYGSDLLAGAEQPPQQSLRQAHTPDATVAEDDVLYQTLEEETQKMIKVMRRLRPGVRVQTLLDEIRQNQGGNKAGAKKKSWWNKT